MHYSSALLIGLGLAITAYADFTITDPIDVTKWTPGSQVTVKWVPANGGLDGAAQWPVEIMSGDAAAMSSLGVVGTAKESDGTFTFTVPATFAPGSQYAVRMGEHYSHKFAVAPAPPGPTPPPTPTRGPGPTGLAAGNHTIASTNGTFVRINGTLVPVNGTTNGTLSGRNTTLPTPTTTTVRVAPPSTTHTFATKSPANRISADLPAVPIGLVILAVSALVY